MDTAEKFEIVQLENNEIIYKPIQKPKAKLVKRKSKVNRINSEIKLICQMSATAFTLTSCYLNEDMGILGNFIRNSSDSLFGITKFVPPITFGLCLLENFLTKGKFKKLIQIFASSLIILSNSVATRLGFNGGVIGDLGYLIVKNTLGDLGFIGISALTIGFSAYKIYMRFNKNNFNLTKKVENLFLKKDKKESFDFEDDTDIFDFFPKILNKNYRDKEANTIIKTLSNFGIEAEIKNIVDGLSVKRYELIVDQKTKLNKIFQADEEIALSLGVDSVNIGKDKGLVYIDIPKEDQKIISFSSVFSEIVNSDITTIPIGKNIKGELITSEIDTFPHLLIGGTTNSGKTVFLNSVITSLISKSTPEELNLILIDPKGNEMLLYEDIPHLIYPIVTEPDETISILNWLLDEMKRRYDLLRENRARNINEYNKKSNINVPYIVVVIDELADSMLTTNNEIEIPIVRIAQKARAAGIHLILATQRPSSDIITSNIKANVPSRISFAVQNNANSRIILDEGGAEKLIGKGDMLFKHISSNKTERLQGIFISDNEIEKVVSKVKSDFYKNDYIELEDNSDNQNVFDINSFKKPLKRYKDELTEEVINFILTENDASTTRLRKEFNIGSDRAIKILNELEKLGIVSEQSKSNKPRDILLTFDDWKAESP